MLSKSSGYAKYFDECKYMSCLIKDGGESLEVDHKIWERVTNSMKKHLIVSWSIMKNI